MIPAIGNHLWQSTLFACVAALLTVILRNNRAAVRHALWLAASVKFLVPFALLIGIGSQIQWRTMPVELGTMQQIGEPFTLRATASQVPAPALAIPNPARPSSIPSVLLCVWLAGFAANLLAWWRRWQRARAALRLASPFPCEMTIDFPIPVLSGPARLEPGIFGIFRPVLLLPEGISAHLSPAQFRSIVAHELCHVRRRDNLAAAIHMLVEALFWFHPLVWWIERRMVEERERACDEEVLKMAVDPQDYASGIVNVCRLYLESPMVCIPGVTGANLKRRVETIMRNRPASSLSASRKLLLAAAAIVAVAAPVTVGLLNAPPMRAESARQFKSPTPRVDPTPPAASPVPLVSQVAAPQRRGAQADAPATSPAFQTVSIKAIDENGTWQLRNDGRQFDSTVDLEALLVWAYGVPDFQIAGSPAWVGTPYYDASGVRVWILGQRFEIHASTARPSSEAEVKLMLQALLSDRFKLKLHRESRQIPIYALVIDQGGPKLGPPNPASCSGACGFPNVGGPEGGVHAITARGGTMAGFAEILSNNVDRPVIDKTNLSGGYDFDLPYEHSGPGWRTGLAIFGPLQVQLGLRLDPQMETLPMFVIDSVERPAADPATR